VTFLEQCYDPITIAGFSKTHVHQNIPRNFLRFFCVETLPFSLPQKNSHS
jgi:hypothetical protein